MNTMRWSVGEGWKAPPLPADLARAMSTQDLEQIQEHERGEIEDEEAEKEDEDETQEMIDTQYMGENEEERTVDELEVVLEQEQAGGQAEEHTDPLPPSIDGYLLGEHIQGDAWCVSRLCTDPATGKNYVLKTIPNKSRANSVAVSMLRYLNHPGLVRVREVREAGDVYRVYHEVITGRTLNEWLNENEPLEENTAAILIRQLLEALQYLHSNGMVHYDVTSDSVHVMAEGDSLSLKLSTCCQAVFSCDELIAAACIQRPQFIGPDVLLDKELGKEVDMWAVGVLTFLILTGSMPFSDPRGVQYTFGNIIKGHITHTDRWNSLSPHAKDFIHTLLTVDSTSRLSSPYALKHQWITDTSSHK